MKASKTVFGIPLPHPGLKPLSPPTQIYSTPFLPPTPSILLFKQNLSMGGIDNLTTLQDDNWPMVAYIKIIISQENVHLNME